MRRAAVALALAACGGAAPVSFAPPEALLPDAADPAAIATLPRTANVRAARLLGDGVDLLVSEPAARRLTILTGCPACEPVELGDGRMKPVRAQAVDLDGDGDRDLLVADIGVLEASPTDQGRILWGERDGARTFTWHTIAEGLERVASAEAGDLDGDGDLDVVACVFGTQVGAILLLERGADGAYASRTLYEGAGAIVAYPFDADGDGDLDIAAVVAQTTERVLLFRNQGGGAFATEVIFDGGDPCWGLSGLEVADLDGDGHPDLLVTTGDYADPECATAAQLQHHGVRWLRNDGGRFSLEAFVQLDGAYAVRAADLDGDGDLDLAVAGYRLPDFGVASAEATVAWLRNEGGRLVRNDLVPAPAGVVTLEVADEDGDGRPDLLTGSLLEGTPLDGAHRLALLRNVAR